MTAPRINLASSALVIVLALARVHGALPVTYDSSAASPFPSAQGWTASETILGIASGDLEIGPQLIQPPGNVGTALTTTDSGLAWQINNQLSDPAQDHPRYTKPLSIADQEALLATGWEFKVEFTGIRIQLGEQSARFGWGLSAAVPAANGIDRPCAFVIRFVNAATIQIQDSSGHVMTVNAPTKKYHTLTAQGVPGTTQYRWTFNGIVQANNDFLDTAGDPTPGAVAFEAGTTGATALTTNFRSISLKEDPPTIIHVDSTSVFGQNGISWATPLRRLEPALAAAGWGDQIWVASGTYFPGTVDSAALQPASGVEIYGGFPPGGGDGTFEARNPDPATNQTLISGDLRKDDGPDYANNRDNSKQIIRATQVFATIDGFTISGAKREDGEDGVGVSCQDSDVTLRNCRIVGHQGRAVDARSSRLTFTDCVFADVDRIGVCLEDSTLSASNCEIRAASFGIRIRRSTSAILEDCLIEENENGGLAIERANLTVVRSSFRNNSSPNGGAASLFSEAIHDLEFRDCLFQGNSTGGEGGAVFISGGNSSFINCVFQGNLADDEGGALSTNPFWSLDDIHAELIHCTFQGNHARKEGGAIYLGPETQATLTNSVIWSNRARGSNLSESASVARFKNSFRPQDNGMFHFQNCLVQTFDLSGAGMRGLDGTDPANDPRLVNPIDPALAPVVGGDVRFLPGSPVVNAGGPAPEAEPTDLAGNPRVQEGLPDLGAYEGSVGPGFDVLFPGLDPDADDNGNGLTNYHDYAAGFDPTAFVSPALVHPTIGKDLTLILRQRVNAPDVSATWEKSATLEPDSWSPLVENIDYLVESVTAEGDRQVTTLQLLFDPALARALFVRQRLSTVANP